MKLAPSFEVIGPTVGAGTVKPLDFTTATHNPQARPRSAGQLFPAGVDSPLPHPSLATLPSTTAGTEIATATGKLSS